MTSRLLRLLAVVLAFSLAVEDTGCSKSSSGTTTTGTGDTTPPSSVTSFSATPTTGGLLLSWDEATDDTGISGYRISMVSPVQPASRDRDTSQIVGPGVTTILWSGLDDTETYTFSIIAFDTSNNSSASAATVSATPLENDTTAPEDATNLTGAGGWNDPDTENYVQLNLSWAPSTSSDVSHYIVCISTSLDFESCDVLSYNVGNVTSVSIPGDVPSTALLQALQIDTTYYVRVTTVDDATPANQSTPGVTASVTTTQSVDRTPPDGVTGLAAVPRNQSVDLSWNPAADAAQYRIYVRTPPASETVGWGDEVATVSASSATVTVDSAGAALLNGVSYEFMVAGIDNAIPPNETQGASTAATGDDDATKVSAVPTSDLIAATPNIRGGVFRQDYFDTRDVVMLVSTATAGQLSTDSSTKFYYTLDGSNVDTTITASEQTETVGVYDFTDSRVEEITTGFLYAVTIDFDPSTAAPTVEKVSENGLRPSGDPDHIVLRFQIVKTGDSPDASRLFSEDYLIYPDDPPLNPLPADSFLKFSGMREIRDYPTANAITSGNTAGDVIFLGGLDSIPLDSASRYRATFEHFEPIRPASLGATLVADRYQHRTTTLADGETLLVTGGYNFDGLSSPADGSGNESLALRTFETFSADATDEGFGASASNMDVARRFHAATRLFDGRVLLTGGINGETNVLGSLASPVSSVQRPGTTTPTARNVSFDTTVISVPGGEAFLGEVVEILSGAGGTVLEQGVIVEAGYSTIDTDIYNFRVDGLLTAVAPGTSFRVIRGPSSSAEDFTSAGAAGATVSSSLNLERYGHSATLLQDGTVFIAGGAYDYSFDAEDSAAITEHFSCEIYRPDDNSFTELSTVADLSTTRFFHRATLLRDGKVLITGGVVRGDHAYRSNGFIEATLLDTAEIYDPFTRTTRLLDDAMEKTRFGHASTLLPSGKVLICGGFTGVTDSGVLTYDDTAEIYDPDTEQFTATGSMLTPRGACAAVLIDADDSQIDGQVLVGGGADNFLAELYDPAVGRFSPTAHGMTYDHFVGSSATMLMDGRVLVAGGQTNSVFDGSGLTEGGFLDTAEIYDTSSVSFTRTEESMATARRHHTATLLQDGTVLIAGGESGAGGLADCEIYDPDEDTFTSIPRMIQERYKHTATLLPDGRVFLCGGASLIGPLQSCEIYDPATGGFTSAPSLQVGRFDHTATLLPNGWVLITGGESIDDTSVEVFDPASGMFLQSAAALALALNTGRDGHRAVRPAYAIGRARFRNGDATVVGSNGSRFGYEDTAWLTSGRVRAGDLIFSEHQNTPYVIESVDSDNQLTVADIADFDHDDSGYSGDSTVKLLTNGRSASGFEYYVIESQDVYIAGGEVADVSTEVFDFDTGTKWPTADPAAWGFLAAQSLDEGHYGHSLESLADMAVLIVGGRDRSEGQYTTVGGTLDDFTDDVWTDASLDSRPLDFTNAFRLQNQVIIVTSQHSAHAFFHD